MAYDFAESNFSWVKFGEVRKLCVVGREHVCVAEDCYIEVTNLNTNEIKLYRAIDKDHGMGVQCVNGHKSLPVLCFAEYCVNPRIFALTCPDFKRISVMTGDSENGILNLSLSDAEILISLDNFPEFNLTLWNWRTGEKLARKESGIIARKHTLRCSFGSQVHIAHLGYNSSKINVWDFMVCGKNYVMVPHAVKCPEKNMILTAAQWTSETMLFVCDNRGHIYMLNEDYNLELAIPWDNPGDQVTTMVWFKAGIVVSGPDSNIKHYKKSGSWVCDWQIKPEVAMSQLLCTPRDFLLGIDNNKDLMVFDKENRTFRLIKEHENAFDTFCLINPEGKYVVVLEQRSELSVFDVRTGKMVDTLKLSAQGIAMAEHPLYPYFGVSFANGFIRLFSFYKDHKINLLTTFHLTKNPLNRIDFWEDGLLIVAGNLTIGEFFVIEGTAGTDMEVVSHVKGDIQVADYILVASKTCFRLFAIKVTHEKYMAGNIITRFCVIRGRPCPNRKDYQLENPNVNYTHLYTTRTPTRDRTFYATSLTSKYLHVLETKRGDAYARLINKIATHHKMRNFRMHFSAKYIISFGYDGLVITRNKDFELATVVMLHNRMEMGISVARVVPSGEYVVSLGKNNVFVGTRLKNVRGEETEIDEELEMKLDLMFGHRTRGFLPTGELEGKTWLEFVEIMKILKEYKQCKKNRQSILRKFREIQKNVQTLLTKNLEGPENEYLDVQDFNLDNESRERRIVENKRKCDETKRYLEALILAQDKVSNWIKTFCWDTMALPGRSIFGIFSNADVQKYAILSKEENIEEVVSRIEEQRRIEEMMSRDDMFEPWAVKSPSQTMVHLEKSPKFKEIEKTRKDIDFDEDVDVEGDTKNGLDEETVTAFAGTITHMFVVLNYGHYDQHQIQTFLQTEYETILSKIEKLKLREKFNEKFEQLMSVKMREFNNVVEKNAKLRHVISELNFFSEKKCDLLIVDPEWRQEEHPENVLKVKDEEIPVMPYISPSQQAILDAEAAEAERIRLLLLADDFKERALMKMMNGVLEVKWEDELKKDVPIPKCMIEKKPENFNEEDLRAIRAYEEQVKTLISERERYKRILVAEYANVGASQREGVKKFNSRIDELILEKIKIDSAILQENLKVARLKLRNMKRATLKKQEEMIMKSIADDEKKTSDLQKLINSLYEVLNESRAYLENLTGKDKLLDKAFKKDMGGGSPSAQELAWKLLRRRPKTNVRNISSITVTLELAKCVITHERSIILNQDCLDYLRALDSFDMYIGVPNVIDENLYAIICKHRRIRIENELKVKAASMEVTESEATIATFQKTHTQYKETTRRLQEQLAKLREDMIKETQDIELQIIIKEGLVEVEMGGEIKDFDDAIMVARSDVERINEMILKEGGKKIKAIKESMNFRRGIISAEWEHKRLKMIIEDLKTQITDIYSVKLTKEIQSYLKSKARGDQVDKGLTFEQEVELVKQSYQRIIDEKKSAIKEIQEKIDSISRSNKLLDKQIADVNVDICDFKLDVDEDIMKEEKSITKTRMATLMKRTQLVKQIQKNHHEILMLQTELELLYLRTYPTLKYKNVNE